MGKIGNHWLEQPLVHRKATVTNGVDAKVQLIAFGDQGDLDAVTLDVTGGARITVGNVLNGLRIKTVVIAYPAGFNPDANFGIIYGEPFGNTLLSDMVMPAYSIFNIAGTIQTSTFFSVSNTAGVVTAVKSSLAAGAGYTFRFDLF